MYGYILGKSCCAGKAEQRHGAAVVVGCLEPAPAGPDGAAPRLRSVSRRRPPAWGLCVGEGGRGSCARGCAARGYATRGRATRGYATRGYVTSMLCKRQAPLGLA